MPKKDVEARRAYHREYINRRYHEDPEFKKYCLKQNAASRKLYREKAFKLVAEFKKNGCAVCKETEYCVLTAHHLDPREKDFPISSARKYGVRRIAQELAKCVCLCFNCHHKLHAWVIVLPLCTRDV